LELILTDLNNAPIFIVGVHRSGTTLLRYVLNSHPRIYIPPETDFIPYFFNKHPHAKLSQKKVARILDIIFSRYRYVEDWQGARPDSQEFYERMPTKDPSAFLNQLYSDYARQNGALRWGDKTPIYASYVDLIHKIFPEAQFIHIIRDPFDASISLLEKYQEDEFHVDIYFAARNWVRRIKAIQASRKTLPVQCYYEVRYEEFVSDAITETQNLCEFIGEEYFEEMNKQHLLARQEIPTDSHFFSNVRKPVFTNSVNRGRRDLSLADRRVIQRVAGELMAELGYPLEDLGVMSISEKLRLTVLHLKYEILQAGRSVLQVAGLFPPI
jgi:hypothetical protein